MREREGYELVVVPGLLFRCFNKVVFHRKSIVYFAVTRVVTRKRRGVCAAV